jgi:hypothetical protein
MVMALQHEVAQLRRMLFGRRSEKLLPDDPNQALLFGRIDPQEESGAESSSGEEDTSDEEPAPRRRRTCHHGRRPLPAHLMRCVHDIHPPEEERTCPSCGHAKRVFGRDVTEELEMIPAKCFVNRYVRHKYACPHCQGSVSQGPLPPRPIDKGIPGPGFLADLIASKYSEHRVQGKAVSEMRGGLSWPGDRIRPQTSPNCGGKESSWETSGAKGATGSRQVRSAKSNASEPLMTCRNSISSTSKLGSGDCPRISMRGSLYPAHAASGIKTARSQIRLRHGTLEPVASMLREKSKRTTREDESTDARHRGGTTRSSDEGRVMRLERRGCVIQSSDNRPTASAGGTHA